MSCWEEPSPSRLSSKAEDCAYEGKIEFRGPNKGDLLELSPFQRQKFQADAVSDPYPRYIILKVNDLNHWSNAPLEQWSCFLSTTDIPEDADVTGLQSAREKLDLMRMSRDERVIYECYLMDCAILRNTVDGARYEGKYEGMKERMEKRWRRIAAGITTRTATRPRRRTATRCPTGETGQCPQDERAGCFRRLHRASHRPRNRTYRTIVANITSIRIHVCWRGLICVLSQYSLSL